MAYTSDVIGKLDQIAHVVNSNRAQLGSAKEQLSARAVNLAAIPTQYGDIIAEIQAYTGADAFEEQAKAILARLTSEFISLKDEADTAVLALASITEF